MALIYIVEDDQGICEIEEMARALEASSGFRMDNVQTVLYGVCGDCRGEESSKISL